MRKTGTPVENSTVVELRSGAAYEPRRRGRPPKHKALLHQIAKLKEWLDEARKANRELRHALQEAQTANRLLRNEIQSENQMLILELRHMAEEAAKTKVRHERARAKWKRRK